MTVQDTVAAFRDWLYLPDEAPLLAILGTVAANLADGGDPVWMMLVGPPASGKTEILNAITSLPYVTAASTLNTASLLSGTPRAKVADDASGGLLRRVGTFGVLVLKDFGSILSMHREPRAEVLAALREIYDGSWTRHLGTDGGKSLHWQGKVGLVAGATHAIEGHHAALAALGERWLTYRLPVIDGGHQATRALENVGREARMRSELGEAVFRLLGELPRRPVAPVDAIETERLVELATVAARCRSSVERHAHTREIESVPAAEGPGRLVGQLARLRHGLRSIGCDEIALWRVVTAAALDSIPQVRRLAFDALLHGGETETAELGIVLGLPTTTVRRALEDLVAHDVLRRVKGTKSDSWAVQEWMLAAMRVAVPETSAASCLERPNVQDDIPGTIPAAACPRCGGPLRRLGTGADVCASACGAAAA